MPHPGSIACQAAQSPDLTALSLLFQPLPDVLDHPSQSS